MKAYDLNLQISVLSEVEGAALGLHLANSNFRLRNYQESMDIAEDALSTFESQNDSIQQENADKLASLHNTIAKYWGLMSSFEKSEYHFEKAIKFQEIWIDIETAEADKEKLNLGLYYSQWANLYLEANKQNPNNIFVLHCQDKLRKLDSINSEVNALALSVQYWNIQSVLYTQIKDPLVWTVFESLLGTLAERKLPKPTSTDLYTTIYNNLGFAYLRVSDDPFKALTAFRDAATFLDTSFQFKSINDIPLRIITDSQSKFSPFNRRQLVNLKGLATTYHRLYNPKKKNKKYLDLSLMLHRKADTLITRMRQMFPDVNDKKILAYDSPDIYEDAIQVCYKLIQLGDSSAMEDAFRFMQVNKAPSLRRKNAIA